MAENITETIIPYARSIPVKLIAERLAPNRKHYIYINNVLCNNYIKSTSITTGEISNISLIREGSGYSSSNTKINFIGSNTKTAKATANIANGWILGIDINDRGAGYSSNVYITITGSGTNAYAVPGISFVPGADLISDKFGKIEFSMVIPNDGMLKFPTGTLTFIISDHPTDPTKGNSSAVCSFLSKGTQKIINTKIKTTPISSRPTTKDKPVTGKNSPVVKNPITIDDGKTNYDDPTTSGGNIETLTPDPITQIPVVTYKNLPLPNPTKPTSYDVYGNVITYDYYYTKPKGFTESISLVGNINSTSALNSAVFNGGSGYIDQSGKLEVSGVINVAGLPLYVDGNPVYDGKMDGLAKGEFQFTIPPGYNIPADIASLIDVSMMNEKNGRDGAKRVTASFDPVTRTVTGSFTLNEKADGANQKYITQISLQTTPDTINYSEKFLTTYRASYDSSGNFNGKTIVDSVPSGSGVVVQSTPLKDAAKFITDSNRANIETTQPITNSGLVQNVQQTVTTVTQNESTLLYSSVEQYAKEILDTTTQSTITSTINDYTSGVITADQAKQTLNQTVQTSQFTGIGTNEQVSNANEIKAAVSSTLSNLVDALKNDGVVYDSNEVAVPPVSYSNPDDLSADNDPTT